MAVVQEAFFIPDDIMTGVLTGRYKIFGGVVRHARGPNRGQIVKHLKPVDMKEAEAAQGAVAKGMQAIRANPKATIAIGAGAVLIGGGAFVYKKLKSREPEVLKDFRQALNQYLEAIRSGEMDLIVIDIMTESLQKLKQHKDYEKFSIQLTTEDIETLVNMIQDYTVKLAVDNEINIDEINTEKSTEAIIDLEKYLAIQKRVFEEVA